MLYEWALSVVINNFVSSKEFKEELNNVN